MRVQIIYGEHTELDLRCAVCRGSGTSAGAAGNCWYCYGTGSMVGDQRAYTYEAPDGTKVWDVLVTPIPGWSGQHGTVVKLGSDYDGPCKEAYPLPRPTPNFVQGSA